MQSLSVFFTFILVAWGADITRDEASNICPQKSRPDPGSWSFCVDYSIDRNTVLCSNCANSKNCTYVSNTGYGCKWSDADHVNGLKAACVYEDSEVKSLFIGFLVAGIIGLPLFGICHYRFEEQMNKDNTDVKYWARMMRWLEYKVDVEKNGPWTTNLSYYLCNELESLKLFFGDYAHYVSRFESLTVLMFGFWLSGYFSVKGQEKVDRDSERSYGEELGFQIIATIIITFVSVVYLVIAAKDEHHRVTKGDTEPMKSTMIIWFTRGVLAMLFIFAMIMFGVVGDTVPELLNPRCTVYNLFFYGIFLPQIFRMVLICLKFWLKWQIEMNDGCQNKCCRTLYKAYAPEKITLNNNMLDEIMFASDFSLSDLREAGIHYKERYAHSKYPSGKWEPPQGYTQNQGYSWYNPFAYIPSWGASYRHQQYSNNSYLNWGGNSTNSTQLTTQSQVQQPPAPVQTQQTYPQQQVVQPNIQPQQAYPPQQQNYAQPQQTYPQQQNHQQPQQNYPQQQNYAQPQVVQPNVQPNYQNPQQFNSAQPFNNNASSISYNQPAQPQQQQQNYAQPFGVEVIQPNVVPQTSVPQYSQDLNNNGIPDHYETNLPPGWAAAKDPNSGRIYWVDHNNHTSAWTDPRTSY